MVRRKVGRLEEKQEAHNDKGGCRRRSERGEKKQQ
jgi:hypothetical protein